MDKKKKWEIIAQKDCPICGAPIRLYVVKYIIRSPYGHIQDLHEQFKRSFERRKETRGLIL